MMNHRMIQALLVTALIVAPSIVSAQTRMTLLGGVALSRVEGTDESEFSNMRARRGLHVTVTADIPLFTPALTFSPGGAFTDRGFHFGPEATEAEIKLSYIEIISPLRVAIPVAGPVGLSLFAGPGFGLSMGCQFKARTSPQSISMVDCRNGDFDFKSIDVVGIAGAGISFTVPGDTRLLLNGAFDTSLVSIRNDADVRHRTWLIQAGASYAVQGR
jgi:hypothetical protein